jgi:hypothetical protein
MRDLPLSGSLRILFLFDVCEEIRTETLQRLIGGERFGEGAERRRDPSLQEASLQQALLQNTSLQHTSPEYVRFERPPVVQQLGNLTFETGEQFQAEMNYYEYGVVSLKLAQPFDLDWPELVVLSAKWIAHPRLEGEARRIARECLRKAAPALIKPQEEWLCEEYFLIHLHNGRSAGDGCPRFRASDLIARHGRDIARIVRGELAELSEDERREILGSQMSYYPEDLLVAGWTAAFVCDTPEGAVPTVQVIEYANTQLLECTTPLHMEAACLRAGGWREKRRT